MPHILCDDSGKKKKKGLGRSPSMAFYIDLCRCAHFLSTRLVRRVSLLAKFYPSDATTGHSGSSQWRSGSTEERSRSRPFRCVRPRRFLRCAKPKFLTRPILAALCYHNERFNGPLAPLCAFQGFEGYSLLWIFYSNLSPISQRE